MSIASNSLVLVALLRMATLHPILNVFECLHYHMSANAMLCKSCNDVSTYDSGLTLSAVTDAHNGTESLGHRYEPNFDSQRCAIKERNTVHQANTTLCSRLKPVRKFDTSSVQTNHTKLCKTKVPPCAHNAQPSEQSGATPTYQYPFHHETPSPLESCQLHKQLNLNIC